MQTELSKIRAAATPPEDADHLLSDATQRIGQSSRARASRLDAQKHRRFLRETLPAPLDDRIDMLRLIVQLTWIDVRTVRPDKCTQLGAEYDTSRTTSEGNRSLARS